MIRVRYETPRGRVRTITNDVRDCLDHLASDEHVRALQQDWRYLGCVKVNDKGRTTIARTLPEIPRILPEQDVPVNRGIEVNAVTHRSRSF
jgi:hypothetical protein